MLVRRVHRPSLGWVSRSVRPGHSAVLKSNFPILLLVKAGEQFADPDTPHERIRSIDDVVLFKVKIGRWCGATYVDQAATEARDWLVAAGRREDGTADDFYAALHAQARAARQRLNAEHDKPLTTDTHSRYLLPGQDDQDR